MNILVLNPPFKTEHGKFSTQSRSPSISKGGTVYYPYFLAYAVGNLEKSGYAVDFIDACADRIKRDGIPLLVRNSPRMIVIGTTTPSIYEDIETTEYLRRIYPESFIVLVGTHVSFQTEEVFKMSGSFDAIARKEYDNTLLALAEVIEKYDMNHVQSNKPLPHYLSFIKGLSFRDGKKVIHNEDADPIENIDELPFVSKVYKKHLDIRNYFFAASDYPMVQILSARGCLWGKCMFCMTPSFEGPFRKRSVTNFVDELEWINNNLPDVKEVGIEDGTFGPNKRVQDICKEIIIRDLDIKWYCNVRVTLDLETMKWMKKAGCHLVTVGFESSSPEILHNIRKGISVNQMKQFVKNAKEAGILVHGCFMLGNPGETRDTLKNNLKLAIEMGCDTMQFFPLMVYPGTQAYEWAKKNGFITYDEWDKWVTDEGQYNTVISNKIFTSDELRTIANQQLKDYHVRPRYIFYKAMRMITNPDEIIRTAKGFRSFVTTVILKRSK